MTTLSLLADLYNSGAQLIVSGDGIRVRAPRGVLTKELRQALAEHKQKIIEALGEGSFPDSTLPDEIYVPPRVNTVEAIRVCIYSQRVSAAA